MNKIFIKKTLSGLAAFCVLFAVIACKNTSEPAEIDSTPSAHDGPVLHIKASTGAQSASKSNISILDSERTIKPECDVTDLYNFAIYGRRVGTENWWSFGSFTDYNSLTQAELELNKTEVREDWSFKLEAMRDVGDSFVTYSGTTTVTIEDGDNDIFIVLKNEETGTGDFAVTVDYSAVDPEKIGLADNAWLELYGDNNYKKRFTVEHLSTDYPSHIFTLDPKADYDIDLETGSYMLFVTIFTAEHATLATWSESVIISKGELCEGTIEIKYFDVLYDVTYSFPDASSATFTPMTQVSPSTEKLPEPILSGYIFVGWYTDYQCTELLESPVTQNSTLYGKWVPASGTVSEVAGYISQIEGKTSEHPAVLKITETISSSAVTTIRNALNNDAKEGTYFSIDLSSTGLTYLTDYAFKDCNNLVEVILPDELTEIGDYAFSGCESLERIVIPDNVTQIFDSAFIDCYNLTSVTIGTGYHYGNIAYTFKDCYNLEEVIIPEGHSKYIKADDGAIYSTDGATLYWYPPYLGNEVVIADTVETIAAYAFCNNDLSSITIGENVSSIGENSFIDCDDLETITVADENEHYKAEDNVLFTKDGKKIVLYPADKIGESYTIPETVTFIPVGVFSENGYLESIEFVYDGFVWYYSDDYDAGTITEDYILNHWTVLSFDADFLSNCDWSEGESYNEYYFVKTSERNWTESVIKLPAGTNGTAGTSATYVYFGDWPQTIRNENIPVDTTETITRGGYTYYKGSDNYWYAFCEEIEANGDGKYSNGDSVEGYKYFRVEPIKWRVLTEDFDGDGNALLLAENILNANIV